MTANPIVDIANSIRDVALQGLHLGERPSVIEQFHHHTPFVPQAACCTEDATEDYPFGRDGFLTTSVPNTFGSQRFPNPSTDPEGPNPPTAAFMLRLWRCFTTIDSSGHYDTEAASAKSAELAQDLAILWAALDQAGRCDGNDPPAGEFEGTLGCQRVVVADARAIRIQAGCAGWDLHLIASWIPLQFPPPEDP